jgi:hypothetical protein
MFELDIDLLFVVILVAVVVVSRARACVSDSFAALPHPECVANESGYITGVPLLTIFIL